MRATTELNPMWFIELGKYAVLLFLFRAYKIGVKEWIVFAVIASLFRLTLCLGPVTLASVFLLNRLFNRNHKRDRFG